MTIDELKLVRQIVVLRQNETCADERESAASHRRAAEFRSKADALMHGLEDAACEHQWRHYVGELRKCSLCASIRVEEDTDA